jgi:acetyl-CoA acetyltransferase
MYEYGVPKEHFGYVAINDRTNAARNPAAAMREPITMDDYLTARMIRWPLCLLDMDVPVDGALATCLAPPCSSTQPRWG